MMWHKKPSNGMIKLIYLHESAAIDGGVILFIQPSSHGTKSIHKTMDATTKLFHHIQHATATIAGLDDTLASTTVNQ